MSDLINLTVRKAHKTLSDALDAHDAAPSEEGKARVFTAIDGVTASIREPTEQPGDEKAPIVDQLCACGHMRKQHEIGRRADSGDRPCAHCECDAFQLRPGDVLGYVVLRHSRHSDAPNDVQITVHRGIMWESQAYAQEIADAQPVSFGLHYTVEPVGVGGARQARLDAEGITEEEVYAGALTGVDASGEPTYNPPLEPWNGCFTGDCPHDNANECVRHLAGYVAELERDAERGVGGRAEPTLEQAHANVDGIAPDAWMIHEEDGEFDPSGDVLSHDTWVTLDADKVPAPDSNIHVSELITRNYAHAAISEASLGGRAAELSEET
jgi:hypothetical protein